MALTTNPYLTFPQNNTREAFSFYGEVFGAEPSFTPLSGMPGMEDRGDIVMHAELKAPEITLMASDNCTGEEIKPGSQLFTIAFMATPEVADRAKELFAKLSAGGDVSMPLEAQPWGDTYGQFTDRFGVQWAFNINEG